MVRVPRLLDIRPSRLDRRSKRWILSICYGYPYQLHGPVADVRTPLGITKHHPIDRPWIV